MATSTQLKEKEIDKKEDEESDSSSSSETDSDDELAASRVPDDDPRYNINNKCCLC